MYLFVNSLEYYNHRILNGYDPKLKYKFYINIFYINQKYWYGV